ncbi:MAG: hypothetical protein K2U26_01905, partial [Cyclobacteriaceae bacterium]|nr:hypothetical protein [Cyclobacteriaceae bacterium]
HAGIISYPPLHHTENSHPTKLFEYIHYRLPIIVDNHWPWTHDFNDVQPFALFDFSNPDYTSLLETLKTKSFYLTEAKDVTWLSEEKKLLEITSQIIKRR